MILILFIGRLIYLRRFNSGISNLSFLEGTDYFSIIQIIPFIICDSGTDLMDSDSLLHFVKIFELLLSLSYLIFKTEIWDPTVVKEYWKTVFALYKLFSDKNYTSMSKTGLNYSRFHELYHMHIWIGLFGAPCNYDEQATERNHKRWAKDIYKGTSRQKSLFAIQMMKRNQFRCVVEVLSGVCGLNATCDIPDFQRKLYKMHDVRILLKNTNFEIRSRENLDVILERIAEKLAKGDINELKAFEKQIREGTVDVRTSNSFCLSRSNETVVASNNIRGKSRYDWIEIERLPGSLSFMDEWFAQVRIVIYAFGVTCLVVKNAQWIPNLKPYHPVLNCPQITWQIDRKNTYDFTRWDVVFDQEVIGRRLVIPKVNTPNEFFVHNKVLL